MGHVYAGILGPLAFIIIVTRSLISGGGAETTLRLACVCLFVFAGIGYIVGQIADNIVFESVKLKFDEELRIREAENHEAS